MYNDFGQYIPQASGEKVLRIFGITLTKSKIAIILLVLALIIETVFLVLFITGILSPAIEVIDINDTSSVDGYIYDDNGKIISMSAVCESDKDYYMFSDAGEYESYTKLDEGQGSGEYSFSDENTLILYPHNQSEKILKYQNGNIIDGTTTYSCKTETDSSITQESSE